MLSRVLALAAIAAVAACGSTTLAQTKTLDDQTVCPIMINKKVDAESKIVEYQGIKIKMCCDTCVGRFEKYPEAYLDEKYIPQLNGLKIPERKIVQKFCPVYPDRVVTEKDPYVIYKGHKVYLFNKAAMKKWTKNPDKYADEKVLPQLALPVDPVEAASPPYSPPKDAEEEEEEGKDDK